MTRYRATSTESSDKSVPFDGKANLSLGKNGTTRLLFLAELLQASKSAIAENGPQYTDHCTRQLPYTLVVLTRRYQMHKKSLTTRDRFDPTPHKNLSHARLSMQRR